MKTVVLTATLNEEHFLPSCLESLLGQERPYPVVVVDSASTDRTPQIAKDYGAEVLTAPRGKLNALDFALRNVDADTVLLTDADRIYPSAWTRHITAPLADPNVVMVSGIIDSRNQNFLDPHFLIAPWLEGTLAALGHHYSGNTAIRTWAYAACGGYNLGVNQKDFLQTWNAEEFEFPRRMQRVGTVTLEPKAVAYTSSRRFQLLSEDPGFAAKRTLTF